VGVGVGVGVGVEAGVVGTMRVGVGLAADVGTIVAAGIAEPVGTAASWLGIGVTAPVASTDLLAETDGAAAPAVGRDRGAHRCLPVATTNPATRMAPTGRLSPIISPRLCSEIWTPPTLLSAWEDPFLMPSSLPDI
jgi:hypothetical protein